MTGDAQAVLSSIGAFADAARRADAAARLAAALGCTAIGFFENDADGVRAAPGVPDPLEGVSARIALLAHAAAPSRRSSASASARATCWS